MIDIYEAIQNIPNGRFFRLTYRTQVPLKAEYRNAGWEIYKVTTRVARTGIDYRKLKSEADLGIFKRKSINWNWLLKHKIKSDTETGADYLIIVPMRKGECKSWYMVTYHNNKIEGFTTEKQMQEMILPSYKHRTGGFIRMINLKNITDISYKEIRWTRY